MAKYGWIGMERDWKGFKYLKMPENGWKILEMAQRGWPWMYIASNGYKCLEMNRNGWSWLKWPDVPGHGFKWPEMAEISLNCLKMLPLNTFPK